MKISTLSIVRFIASAYLCASFAVGRPDFPTRIPNGFNIVVDGEPWTPVGHFNRDSSRATPANLNSFGRDFRAAGYAWTVELCRTDSDGDGLTNGEELGDPSCRWREGDSDPVMENPPTHPGLKNNDVTPDYSMQIAHGVCMILAWFVFAPTGVLLALTQKTKGKAPFVWYKYHKVCMVTAVFLCLVAYVIMVYFKAGFSISNTHERIGTAVVILCIIQPLSGAFRVHISKDGTKTIWRRVWEFQHQWTGRITMMLAIGAIFLGLEIWGFTTDTEDVTDGVRYFIACSFGVVSILLVFYVLGFRKDERGVKKAQGSPEPAAASQSAAGEVEMSEAIAIQ